MEAKYGKEMVNSFGMGGVNYSELNMNALRQSGLASPPPDFAKPQLMASGAITIKEDGSIVWHGSYVDPYGDMPRYNG